MICRDHQSLFYQYIDFSNVAKYIDDLKSRMYKAFFEKSLLKVNLSQSSFANSPLALIISVKQVLKNISLQASCFEIGYLIFCLSRDYLLDTSFYYYYQEEPGCNMAIFIERSVEKVKYFVVSLLFDSYYDYLCSSKDSLILCCSYSDILSVLERSQANNQTILCLNLEPSFAYINLSILIDRLLLDISAKSYLRYHLRNGAFNSLIYYLGLSFSYAILSKNPPRAFRKLINIVLLHVFHEILTASGIVCDLRLIKTPINIAHFGLTIFIFSCHSFLSESLLKILEEFLQFNGVYMQRGLIAFSSLFARVNLSSGFALSTSQYCHTQAISQPSLYAQLVLMQRISSAISRSMSQPLFLSIIRLNMLLFSWLSFVASNRPTKSLCIIDYLISLKVRYFIKARKSLSYDLYILLLEKAQLKLGASYILAWSKTYGLIFTASKSNDLYRHYILAKMRWIYRIKCLSN